MTADAVDPVALARTVVQTCGLQRTVHVGAADDSLVTALLGLGCEAVKADAATTRDRAPHTVLATTWLDDLADEQVPPALASLHASRATYVFVAVKNGVSPVSGTARDRAWWEARCFAAGFRKHAAYYRVNAYAALERDAAILAIPLERIPDAAFARWPLEILQRTRQLHMDMLREVGRRGDAHCIRYHMAAQHIHPGDVVLDLACGYGYGSWILWHNSLARSVLGVDLEANAIDYAQANYTVPGHVQFAQGNAQSLSGLADHSVDFIATFETIEHLPDPDLYLDELRRVLRPAGRVMVCAPNDWSDETGKDPNPHHLHVYTWDRLRRELGARFLLEKGFVQTAGGAMKCHHSPRTWTEVPLATLSQQAEWILLLAMADPLPGADVPYRETRWALPDDPDFHFLAFGRDYRNPWLAKAMVTIGMRFEEPTGLRAMHEQVLREAPPDSVDHGAALCGQAYAALAAAPLEPARFTQLLTAIRAYAALPAAPPHRLRWQISLLFVGGELARQRGETGLARELFEDCAGRDACRFSPLLGNKTLEALFRLATMDVAAADLPRARERLQRTIVEARRMVSGSWLNVCGDLARPIPAGLAELAQLLDKASRAAYALVVLESALQRPAMFAWEARGWFERILDFKNGDLADLRRGHAALRDEVLRLDAITRQLAAQVVAKEARLQELAAEIARKEHQPQDLTRQPGSGRSLGFVRRCLQFLFGKRA